ncbi:MAG: DNA/RNA nuclease SfsA [Pseudanabaenaceae cyanobacterium SKYGB_i_bin29]|nr:DNA/RNA nuclease SfsA [Pseudanabaenaceae cyanobacterium SKYG29]MDW8422455.1 DNA/RNA nuclease SfsA [Pseudanabaenaceae cyanobacterium SKYGB_i_bin29]
MLVYAYPPLVEGILLQRYQRFFADVRLMTGEIITAHCPNTGPMTGVCPIGNRVFLSRSDNPKRKLVYTWEIVEVEGELVGINTSLPNRVIGNMIASHLIPELEPYTECRSEVEYGQERSRVDFFLSGDRINRYVEVKNTTWSKEGVALFPDTVTIRGQKHLRELSNTITPQQRATIIFFINRGDCDKFAPGDEADPVYGELLRWGVTKGLEILACRFRVRPEGIYYLGLGEVSL